ncbi:sugar ABC transporter permease [Anaerocolumna cellulosilytica]|uniref:Sugar ABC transporter permease n=1 Tax=Anaerocolumna cellulosilytica TaxID=433286 RepID=A0A6S6R708_9FIRM|nr:ABC transporter permease subunit [Anaerocolumna cellulosilytica]MBB5193728.1 putative aldouronate transport system permease protein [Anaerocolumna cellulosilytica]BCJ95055.1 sugar ABC transporter permease [Anaerocolumna cellulosilytica]
MIKQESKNRKNLIQKKNFLHTLKRDYPLWLFVLPGIIITFIFSYVPLYGVQIAFRNYNPKLGFWDSNWVGLKHFMRFFNSPYFASTIKNTLILSVYSLIAGFPIPIIFALLVNSFRHKKYKKIIQTVAYAPNFISTVVMCGMLLLFLSPSVGIINNIIELFGGKAVNFMGVKNYWRHIYVWSGIWQGMGWSSVIYFAALSSVSPELHEAAVMDGASKFQIVRYIDFPSIIPTATILLILNCGSILSVGFEKVFLLQNDLNLSVSQVISTYVYQVGLIENSVSYSTAIGLFNSAVNALLLIAVNKISDKLSGISLW